MDRTEEASNGHVNGGTSALDSTVESIRAALDNLQRPRERQNELWIPTRRAGSLSAGSGRAGRVRAGNVRVQRGENAQDLKHQISAEGLKEVVDNLNDMATAVEPVTASFDKVLVTNDLS